MKTKLLNLTGLRSLLLLACMMLGVSAWGEEVTFTYSDYQGQGTQSEGSVYTMEKTDVSITSTKFYGNNSYAHFYANGEITIKPVNGVTITQVELTATGTSYNGYQSNGTISASAGTLSHSGATVTWSGSASSEFTLKNDKQIRWTSIVVTYTPSGVTPPCAIPTFDPAEGNYSQAQKVTISCSTENSTIYYTLDGNDPTTSSSVYSSPITISKTTTVKAIATASGFENSSVASATYTITTPLTIAAAREQGTGNVFTKGIVTSCVGTTGYIQDATAAICVYGKSLTVGDEITVSGTLSTYKGLLEITNPFVTVLSSGNSIAPEVMTIAEVNASTKQGWLVKIEEATVTEVDGRNTTIAQGENTIVVRDISSDVTYGVNDQLTLTGNIGCFETAQIVNPTNISVISNQPPVIKAEDVTLAYDDTYGKIEYTIVNPVNGVALTATSTATWISNITVVDGAVTFDAAENEGTEDRTTTFTLSYTGAEDVTVTVTQKHFVADYAELPFNWAGGTKEDLLALQGVTAYGLGSNYAESNAPYRVKFDTDGDYIQIKTNERPGIVTIGVKMLGGATTSSISVQESADGEEFTVLQTLSISGSSNAVLTLETNTEFAEASRYVRLYFNKGANIGVGPISIAQYAVIVPQEYNLAIANPENVTITANYGEEVLTNGNEAAIAKGTEITLAVTPASGYDLVSVTVEGAEEGQTVSLTEDPTTAGMYSFNMPAFNATVSATVVEHVEPVLASYTLAKSITSGKRYVIASGTEGSIKVMGDQASNNRPAVDATITDGVLSVSETYEFVIESATIDETTGYSIYDNSDGSTGYLYAASSGSNQLKTQKENDVNGVWTITIDSKGLASIVAEGSSNRNVMQYNNGNSLFSCYASASQKPVYLFEKVEAPILLGDVNGDEEVTIADVVAIINYLLDPTSVKFNEAAADFDGQNGVTLADALAIINKIIGEQ